LFQEKVINTSIPLSLFYDKKPFHIKKQKMKNLQVSGLTIFIEPSYWNLVLFQIPYLCLVLVIFTKSTDQGHSKKICEKDISSRQK
jgi:hypothetical protein